jgi:hypothetical protein
MGYSLSECCIDSVEITDASGGETFYNIEAKPGDIIVADAGYSQIKGIAHIVSSGADVILRINWRNMPLLSMDGSEFDLFEHLRTLPVGATGEWEVHIAARPKQGVPDAIRGRVIALRKSEQSAEAARQKIRQRYRRRQAKLSEWVLEAAGYIFLFTTVPAEPMSAQQCLEIYRFRWQIELSFKKLKSIFGLSHMFAKANELGVAYISAILILAILVERMSTACDLFSPWGYATPRYDLSVPSQ